MAISGSAGREHLLYTGVSVASQDGKAKTEEYDSKESAFVCYIKICIGLSEILRKQKDFQCEPVGLSAGSCKCIAL